MKLLLLLCIASVLISTSYSSCVIRSASSKTDAISKLFTCFWTSYVAPTSVYRKVQKADWQRRAGYSPLRPLLTSFIRSRELSPVSNLYKSFINLLLHFNPQVGTTEKWPAQHVRDRNTFLTELVRTEMTRDFLATFRALGYLSSSDSNLNVFRSYLQKTWFNPYARNYDGHKRGVRDSCGFEHVFAGEMKLGDDGSKLVTGFHNWIQMLRLEEQRKLEYLGYFEKSSRIKAASVRLRWSGHLKGGSTIFAGTPPDFEMLLYTACFMLKRNTKCSITLNNQKMKIVNYNVNWQREQLATAYFVLPSTKSSLYQRAKLMMSDMLHGQSLN